MFRCPCCQSFYIRPAYVRQSDREAVAAHCVECDWIAPPVPYGTVPETIAFRYSAELAAAKAA
jgi:hypothetical protein